MAGKRKSSQESRSSTRVVSDDVFRQVYDSPHYLPGKERWVTSDEDVRTIEGLLGMKPKTIGAPYGGAEIQVTARTASVKRTGWISSLPALPGYTTRKCSSK